MMPAGAVQQLRLVWRATSVWRSGLQLAAKQSWEWIFARVQGWVTGLRLKGAFEMQPGRQLVGKRARGLRLGFARGLELELNLASVSGLRHALGQAKWPSFGFGLQMRESSGLVQKPWVEEELTFGFGGTGLQWVWQE